MTEEETFECVFGYGDCPIRAKLVKEQKEAFMVLQTIPTTLDLGKDMKKEHTDQFNIFFQAMTTTFTKAIMVTGGLRDVGAFCTACPKTKRGSEE